MRARWVFLVNNNTAASQRPPGGRPEVKVNRAPPCTPKFGTHGITSPEALHDVLSNLVVARANARADPSPHPEQRLIRDRVHRSFDSSSRDASPTGVDRDGILFCLDGDRETIGGGDQNRRTARDGDDDVCFRHVAGVGGGSKDFGPVELPRKDPMFVDSDRLGYLFAVLFNEARGVG